MKDIRIVTIENIWDIYEDLTGTVIQTQEHDSYILFDNGEEGWISNSAFIIIK